MGAPTIGGLLREAALPRLEATMLLASVLGVDRVVLAAYPERPVDADALERWDDATARRARGEPIAYILGEREFYGLGMMVSSAVLIPRPETELLVDGAIVEAESRGGAVRLLDLGTGSGAIAVAIAHHLPRAAVWAVERSADALAVARANAERHAVAIRFAEGDWFDALAGTGAGSFEIIVANPPYVAAGDRHLGEGDLRFEPRAALAAGADGLDDLRRIVAAAPRHLAPGGWFAVEHGFDQGATVRAMFEQAGFGEIETRLDLAGLERTTSGRMST